MRFESKEDFGVGAFDLAHFFGQVEDESVATLAVHRGLSLVPAIGTI
jgi:hypothetical protein